MNLFGTDGIRNRVGSHPLTQEALPHLGRALACWAEETFGNEVRILLARDTRYSGPWITAGLMQGLLSYPVTVYDAGILPTPGVFHLMQEDTHYHIGIIITASHNPSTDNGIKLVSSLSGKLTRADEDRICKLMMQPTIQKDFSKLGKLIPFQDAKTLYRKKVTAQFNSLSLIDKTIVLDCANGATSLSAPQIFKDLGATVISINSDPDGYNINYNSGSTKPESLSKAVIAHAAYMGFAFDGDGDRVIAVTSSGQIKDGDDLLALLLTNKDYSQEKGIVSTVMANQGLESHLSTMNKKLTRSNVGDKFVLQEMEKEELLLGGEPSGHIILKNLLGTGDGILVALKVLETVRATGNHTLDSFPKFPQVVISVPIKKKKDLAQHPFADYIAACKAKLSSGRLLVRYSGTEPLLRIMAEGQDIDLTSDAAQLLADTLQQELS